MKNQLFKFSVYVNGVARKQRNVKQHIIRLGYFKYTENLTEEKKEEIKKIAKASIDTNIKIVVGNPQIQLEYAEEENDFITLYPFSDKNLKFVI